MTTGSADAKSVYEAVVVVSPAQSGGEKKDQDRAVWFRPGQIACVCDGVTSSPFAAEAAETVATFAPALFGGDIRERLNSVCDVLLARRLGALNQRVSVGPDASAGMAAMLQEVASEKMQRSFQTTMVAANFVVTDDVVTATIVRCGDSAFLAFSPEGELLYSSLVEAGEAGTSPAAGPIRFGPGDTLLARVLGRAIEHPLLVEMVGIPLAKADKWLVCACLERCSEARRTQAGGSGDGRARWLEVGDVLLVPKYLAEAPEDARFRDYVRVRFSSRIRLPASPCSSEVARFDRRGYATSALPDHFRTGGWSQVQERFPFDTGFVLATDGFYGCFADAAELWKWLNDNEDTLRRGDSIEGLAGSLHAKLAGSSGDDDISLVWVRPCKVEPRGTDEHPCSPGKGSNTYARR